MKTRILIALSLILSLLLVGCGDAPVSPSVVGYYTLDSMTQDGTTLDHDALVASGSEGYVVIEDDGEGFIKLGRTLQPLTWEEGGMVIDNKFYAMASEGDTLRISEETSIITFLRSNEEAPAKPDHFTQTLVGVSGRFEWIAVNQGGTTTKVEDMPGYGGYVSFTGDGNGEFGIISYGAENYTTTPLFVAADGKLTDSTGYEIVYDYDGASLLLNMAGDQYLYAPAAAPAE